jgi:arginyl-tRNA synthetase
VVGEAEPVEAFRLGLCVAGRRTLARALGLLGVSAPDSM